MRMHGLETDVAFLPLRIVRAFLDRDRDGLLVHFVGMIFLRATSLFNLLAELVVAALFPVLLLAGPPAVGSLAAATLLGCTAGHDVGQIGGASCAT